jgi:hypothetical protein
MTRKEPTTMTVTGLNMTVEKQQQVGQAVLIRLAQLLNGEIDGVRIEFRTKVQS